MSTHLNIPPGPCPGCGASLRMGQPVCISCGYDRVRGVNLNDKPPRPPLWKLALATPVGFLLTTNSSAIGFAFLADGSPMLVRIYVIATMVIGLITARLVAKDYAADPPGFWQMWSDTAHDWYMLDKLLGDDGPAGMQCLVVLTVVMTIASVALYTGLPPEVRSF